MTSSAMYVCCLCADLAYAITQHRSATPFFVRALQAPRYPLNKSGLIALVALGGFRALLSYRGFIPSIFTLIVAMISLGIYWAYMFSLIRASGNGSRQIEAPEFSDTVNDVYMPAIRGIVATSIIWLPGVIYGVFLQGWSMAEFVSVKALGDPVILVLLAVGLAYAPMAIIAAATGVGVWGMLNPARIFYYIRGMGRDYWVAVGILGVLCVAAAIMEVLAAQFIRPLPIPFISRVLAEIVTLYVPFVMARVLGLLIYVRGEALDWGSSEEYQEPILRGIEPRGTPKSAAETSGQQARAARAAAPINVPAANLPKAAAAAWSGQTTGASESHDAIGAVDLNEPHDAIGSVDLNESGDAIGAVDLNEPISIAPRAAVVVKPPQDTVADQIARAIAANDLGQALKIYSPISDFPAGTLPYEHHFLVGRAAAKGRDFPLAVRALKIAGNSSDPIAPRALCTLAQVYGEGMRDPDMAERLYRLVVQRYPRSDVATFAQKKLAALP